MYEAEYEPYVLVEAASWRALDGGAPDTRYWPSLSLAASLRSGSSSSNGGGGGDGATSAHTAVAAAARSRWPLFDERFVGYGFDKVAYLAALAQLGVNFVVLPDVFITHVDHGVAKWSQKSTTVIILFKKKKNLHFLIPALPFFSFSLVAY